MKINNYALAVSSSLLLLGMLVSFARPATAMSWHLEHTTTGAELTPNEFNCADSLLSFTVPPGALPCSSGNDSIRWEFGDGNNSTGTSTTHRYMTAGQYAIVLVIFDKNNPSCITELTQTIVVISCEEITECDYCIGSFAPKIDHKYVISAWVKEDDNLGAITYNNAFITLTFVDTSSSPNLVMGPFRPSGQIIDGWQRIEEEFVIPDNYNSVIFQLNNGASSGDVYFDDIRIFPFKGTMKSFVYDPINLRLMAELDKNNYATFYEYDDEGRLIRVKKETERGVQTVQESRKSSIKQ